MLYALFPVLMCGGMMLLCMFMMGAFGRRGKTDSAEPQTDLREEVEALRAEVARLRDGTTETTADPTRG
jgi:hypothetical protein